MSGKTHRPVYSEFIGSQFLGFQTSDYVAMSEKTANCGLEPSFLHSPETSLLDMLVFSVGLSNCLAATSSPVSGRTMDEILAEKLTAKKRRSLVLSPSLIVLDSRD